MPPTVNRFDIGQKTRNKINRLNYDIKLNFIGQKSVKVSKYRFEKYILFVYVILLSQFLDFLHFKTIAASSYNVYYFKNKFGNNLYCRKIK